MHNQDQSLARRILQRIYTLPNLFVLPVEKLIQQLQQEGFQWPAAVTASIPSTTSELIAVIERTANVLNEEELQSFSLTFSSLRDFGDHLLHMRNTGQLPLRHVPALPNANGLVRLYEGCRDSKPHSS